jgi:hypothetical protein
MKALATSTWPSDVRGLGTGLITPFKKKPIITKVERRKRSDRITDGHLERSIAVQTGGGDHRITINSNPRTDWGREVTTSKPETYLTNTNLKQLSLWIQNITYGYELYKLYPNKSTRLHAESERQLLFQLLPH